MEQGDREINRVSIDGGPVTITASLTDDRPNTTYIWRSANGVIDDLDGEATNSSFSFEPALLAPGIYTFEATALHPDLEAPWGEIQLPIGPIPIGEMVGSQSGLLLFPLAIWLLRKAHLR